MVDRENREDWRRERSLLALGQAMRGEDDASLVSIGDRADSAWREDAAARHRLARSRREALTNPTLSAGSRRDRKAPVEDQAFRAPPPPAPPMPAAPVPPVPPPPPAPPPPLSQSEAAPAERPGRVAALIAKLRNALTRKPSAEGDDDSEFAAFGDSARPADATMPSGFPHADSAFMPRPPHYSRRPLAPGFDAAYSRPIGPPSRSPLMPPMPVYPVPPPYPPASQAGSLQPWQVPSPAGYPYDKAMAPYSGHMPYPPQPAPPQPPAYPPEPSVDPSTVEESAEQASIEEIRASLRELREAVRELTESRARRRYF